MASNSFVRSASVPVGDMIHEISIHDTRLIRNSTFNNNRPTGNASMINTSTQTEGNTTSDNINQNEEASQTGSAPQSEASAPTNVPAVEVVAPSAAQINAFNLAVEIQRIIDEDGYTKKAMDLIKERVDALLKSKKGQGRPGVDVSLASLLKVHFEITNIDLTNSTRDNIVALSRPEAHFVCSSRNMTNWVTMIQAIVAAHKAQQNGKQKEGITTTKNLKDYHQETKDKYIQRFFDLPIEEQAALRKDQKDTVGKLGI